MNEMTPKARGQFETLHAKGMAAKKATDHTSSLAYFNEADELASSYGDNRKRLDTLNPAARALWSIGEYEGSLQKLKEAASIAEFLDLPDERAMAISNIGRLATVRIVKTVSIEEQPDKLRAQATPQFELAFRMLQDYPHLYYRYANATHGSVTAALAGDRSLAKDLIKEGWRVSHQKSPKQYNYEIPVKISPSGTKLLNAAEFLIYLGNRTPILAPWARRNLVY